jgi:hypothetical protein
MNKQQVKQIESDLRDIYRAIESYREDGDGE